MGPERFQHFLERSLAILAAEKPAVFARLCALLRGDRLSFRIDGAEVGMRFEPLPVVVDWPPESPSIRVVSGRRTILDVVAGSLTLEDAVLGDRIELFGSVADLARFHDALRVYLGGAVRSPGFPDLLDLYLAD